VEGAGGGGAPTAAATEGGKVRVYTGVSDWDAMMTSVGIAGGWGGRSREKKNVRGGSEIKSTSSAKSNRAWRDEDDVRLSCSLTVKVTKKKATQNGGG